jgi:hypothetical protein
MDRRTLELLSEIALRHARIIWLLRLGWPRQRIGVEDFRGNPQEEYPWPETHVLVWDLTVIRLPFIRCLPLP